MENKTLRKNKIIHLINTNSHNNYTTLLDKNNISNEQRNKAEKIVKEIMRESNKDTNIHILEDRGLLNENDIDEEDKYSSVLRKKDNDDI